MRYRTAFTVVLLLTISSTSIAQFPWQKPLTRSKKAVAEILGPTTEKEPSRDLNIVWVWGIDKIHEKGTHEYAWVMDDYVNELLPQVPRVTVVPSMYFPKKELWEKADLVVFYLWPREEWDYDLIDAYQKRGGERNEPSTATHHWIVCCLDWSSGKTLWQKTVHKGRPAQPVHIKNTYASENPVTDGEAVYFYFGNVGVFCFDLEGKELWRKELDPVKIRYNWGTAASPVLHGDSNWVTPYLWQNAERTELVTCGTVKNRSYNLDGKLLWELGPMSVIAIPTPVEGSGLLYVCSGFVGDGKNRPIYAIRTGASGDITLKDGQDTSEYVAWHHRFGGPYNPSPIARGDYLYILYDRGMVSCYDGRTGKVVYEQQQLAEDARAFTASPWANDSKLFFLSEDGDTFVVQAGPEFQVLGRNALGEMCMATPAALRGSIIIRTLTKLYRIEQAPKKELSR